MTTIENNVMRHEYRILSDEEKAHMNAIKHLGLAFYEYCDVLQNSIVGQGRELALAKTKIEEAVFWAVKAVT